MSNIANVFLCHPRYKRGREGGMGIGNRLGKGFKIPKQYKDAEGYLEAIEILTKTLERQYGTVDNVKKIVKEIQDYTGKSSTDSDSVDYHIRYHIPSSETGVIESKGKKSVKDGGTRETDRKVYEN